MTIWKQTQPTIKPGPILKYFRKTGKLHPKYRSRKNITRTVVPSGALSSGAFGTYGGKAPFPPSRTCKLRYSHLDALGVGAGNLYGTQIGYHLNSLYQPKVGGTAQPYGFDQMNALYRKYKVTGVTIKLILSDPNDEGIRFGAIVQAPGGVVNLTGAVQNRVAELPMGLTRDVANSGSQKTIVKQYFPMHKIIGITKQQFDANIEDYAAENGAAPAKNPTLNIAIAQTRGTSSGSVICTTELTFHTRFWERKVFASSTV